MMEGYARFEEVCEAYLNADQEHRQHALEILDEGERETFLQGVCLYRMFTRPEYYRELKQAMGELMYQEFTKGETK